MGTEASCHLCQECGHVLKLCSRTRLATTYARLGAARWEFHGKLRRVAACAGRRTTEQGSRLAEASCCLLEVCAPLKGFRNVLSMS